jgi:hypothetical protein
MFLLQVILLFAFPLAFDRLLEFLLIVSFIFLFGYKSFVLSMHSSRGDRGPCVVRGPVDGRFLV